MALDHFLKENVASKTHFEHGRIYLLGHWIRRDGTGYFRKCIVSGDKITCKSYGKHYIVTSVAFISTIS